MRDMSSESRDWLTSSEARKELRVTSCDLMHLRQAGHLRFKKDRNAFLYSKEDLDQVRMKENRGVTDERNRK
jgi:hypothetical protein